jgi:hypothetical protein
MKYEYNNDDDDDVIIIMQLRGYLLRCRLNGTSVYYKPSKKTQNSTNTRKQNTKQQNKNKVGKAV